MQSLILSRKTCTLTCKTSSASSVIKTGRPYSISIQQIGLVDNTRYRIVYRPNAATKNALPVANSQSWSKERVSSTKCIIIKTFPRNTFEALPCIMRALSHYKALKWQARGEGLSLPFLQLFWTLLCVQCTEKPFILYVNTGRSSRKSM